MFGTGFVLSNAFAGAMTPHPNIAGITGALVGSMQLIGGFFASLILATIHEYTQLPLSIFFTIVGLFGFLLFIKQPSKTHLR